MRNIVLLAVVGVMILNCDAAHAAKTWDDMSWWGNTSAKPEPKTDPKERAGCWWLPVEAAKNEQDGELWGNRGVVFHAWKEGAKRETRPPLPSPVHIISDPAPKLILNNILFDFGKSVLRAEGKVEADKAVMQMKKWGRDTVTLEGYASSEGDESYNNALGLRRAEAVKKYMVESGIAPERITTESFGETRPAVPETSPANQKLNRRVEFKYHVKD